MKRFYKIQSGLLAGFVLVLWATNVTAFPPAPHHILFGTIRNQWGDPIDVTGAEVFVQTTNGIGVRAEIAASAEPGVNYRLRVPMDSGTTLDLYQANALRRNQSFRLRVQIGSTTYLPLEMVLSPTIGQPAGSTRLNLTLGEDTDGDGLPDAWEQAIIAVLGGTLQSITPDGDADGDGISNRDEYLAGTFAFNPADGFSLSMVGLNDTGSRLEFLAVRGRTYTIQTSINLQQWSPVSFRVVNGGTPGPLQSDYAATDIRLLQIEVPFQAGPETNRFFKALVQ
ncbi:MAG TPA: hypothetical protein VNU68_16095 [Verrucomicrobiae bacterium]|nr:hypothetical protein [Verrucomicrobiae bacterium]